MKNTTQDTAILAASQRDDESTARAFSLFALRAETRSADADHAARIARKEAYGRFAILLARCAEEKARTAYAAYLSAASAAYAAILAEDA